MTRIQDQLNEWRKAMKKLPKRMVKQAGEEAMAYISDYPIYATTSNISYEDAILIAIVLGADI